jgi:alkylation response protein AidB-like acyl-CoA dehydrogenase
MDAHHPDTAVSVDDFRQEARSWIATNLERRDPSAPVRVRGGSHHRTREDQESERILQAMIYEAGYAGITWPTEFGGQGLTDAHESAWAAESAGYRLPDFGVVGGTTFGVCAPTMLAHARPDYLDRHVTPILRGEELFCQFFSEPGAGSDLAGVTTRADRDGDRWILNGSKIWSSGAAFADWGMCLARTDWDAPKHRGLTWFAVRIDQPGVTVQPIREINGSSEFCQEFFDDVELSDDDVIGDVNNGWRVAQTMLVFERGAGRGNERGPVGPGALAPDLVALAGRTGRSGVPWVRQQIAQAHINDFAARQLAGRIAGHMRKGGPNSGIAAYGKLANGTLRAARARMAIEIGGASSLAWQPGDEDGSMNAVTYLNGRMTGIAGGTNEVQRNGIGERVLGLPREPAFDIHKPFREVVRDAANWPNES